MKELSYLIYVFVLFGGIVYGCYHVVFVLNRSGWWWLLALILISVIPSPRQWVALWDAEARQQLHLEKLKKIEYDD